MPRLIFGWSYGFPDGRIKDINILDVQRYFAFLENPGRSLWKMEQTQSGRPASPVSSPLLHGRRMGHAKKSPNHEKSFGRAIPFVLPLKEPAPFPGPHGY